MPPPPVDFVQYAIAPLDRKRSFMSRSQRNEAGAKRFPATQPCQIGYTRDIRNIGYNRLIRTCAKMVIARDSDLNGESQCPGRANAVSERRTVSVSAALTTAPSP